MLFNYLYRKLPPPTQSHENNSDWLLAENNLPTSVPSSPTTHSSRLRNLEATLVRKLEKKNEKLKKSNFSWNRVFQPGVLISTVQLIEIVVH